MEQARGPIGWDVPTRVKGPEAQSSWDAPAGMEWAKSLGALPIQNAIRQRPVGVGHTHWNRNEPKTNEEWEVGCFP